MSRVKKQLVQSQVFHIELNGEIDHAENYTEELNVIRCAQPNDTVHIYFNSPGGYVSTAAQLKAALVSCQAETVAHLEGICHSAATIIALTCDEMVVHDHALMLIHTYTGGGWGKSEDLLLAVQANDNWIKAIMRDSYDQFLSREEVNQLFSNQDFWFGADEIRERWKSVLEIRELELEEEEQALRDKIKEEFK